MSHGARQRVVITGLGVVSAWGRGTARFWEGLLSGETAIRDFDRFDHEDYPTHVAGEVPVETPRDGEPPPDRRLSLADRFAIAAAREAVKAARLPTGLAEIDAGVFFGSSTGGMFESETYYETSRRDGAKRVRITPLCSQQLSGPGEAVAREMGIVGPVWSMSAACASATLSTAAALDAVRGGKVQLALTGGADSLCRTTYAGFNALGAVDERPCRPFREDRNGMSLGEGAAVLVLEPLEAAVERGVRPVAELLGAGASADALHMTAPDPSGRRPAVAVRRALDDAGIQAEEIDFINAHGTGTALNDAAEYAALESVFGDRLREIPLTATKGSVGHLLGTAGAIEAAAAALCLRHGIAHPTPGGGRLDPKTPVDLVLETPPVSNRPSIGLSLNFAFGGCNAALVLARWDGV